MDSQASELKFASSYLNTHHPTSPTKSDSLIHIWDATSNNFTKLKTLNLHHGFVKGLAWDPVGQYLASQADDKSLRIWRVADWEEEKVVRKPFEDAASSTFFRRLR